MNYFVSFCPDNGTTLSWLITENDPINGKVVAYAGNKEDAWKVANALNGVKQ